MKLEKLNITPSMQYKNLTNFYVTLISASIPEWLCAVLGTLKIVNLILWTFWTFARSIPILLSISASLLNNHAMIKGV